MGYYLPIRDVQSDEYRRRMVRRPESPYHIERSYKVVFHRISNDAKQDHIIYVKAKKQFNQNKKGSDKRKRFSSKSGKVEGKGEHINVQV